MGIAPRHGAHHGSKVAIHVPPHKNVNHRRAENNGDAPAVGEGVPQIRRRRQDPAPVAAHGGHFAHARRNGGGDEGHDPDGAADGAFAPCGGGGHVGRARDGEERHDGDD